MSGKNTDEILEDLDKLKRLIGQRLRNVRVERKISLKKISCEMQLSYQSVWKYEEGISDMPLSRLLRYCQIVRISSDKIFAGLMSTVGLETAGQRVVPPLRGATNEKSEPRTDVVDKRSRQPPRTEPSAKPIAYCRQTSPRYSLLTVETIEAVACETGIGKATSNESDC
jgi:transcriptional regulator with XRE-family HTH domain